MKSPNPARGVPARTLARQTGRPCPGPRATGAIRATILPGAFTLAPELSGGTWITNNLPADTANVNINARAEGAATFNDDQLLWYHPFNLGGTLLTRAAFSTRGAQKVVSYQLAASPPKVRKIRVFASAAGAMTSRPYTLPR